MIIAYIVKYYTVTVLFAQLNYSSSFFGIVIGYFFGNCDNNFKSAVNLGLLTYLG